MKDMNQLNEEYNIKWVIDAIIKQKSDKYKAVETYVSDALRQVHLQ